LLQHLVLELGNLRLEYLLTGLVEDIHLAGVTLELEVPKAVVL
jgi:hypothetical protein